MSRGRGGGSGPSVDKRFLLQRDTTSAFRPRPSPPPPLAEETDRQTGLTHFLLWHHHNTHVQVFSPFDLWPRRSDRQTSRCRDKPAERQDKNISGQIQDQSQSRTRVSPGPEWVQTASVCLSSIIGLRKWLWFGTRCSEVDSSQGISGMRSLLLASVNFQV